MRKIFLLGLVALVLAPVASADSLEIAIGLGSQPLATQVLNVVISSSTGITGLAGTFDGWTFVVGAISNSPGGSPFLLDLGVVAQCTNATCAGTTLDVFASDTGYAGPAGGFSMTDAGSLTGGSTSAIGWAASANTDFALGGANLIGLPPPSLGPFSTSPFSGSRSGGPSESGPYSVTIEESFRDGSTGSSGFSADSQVTTPEPEALALFGSGLVLMPFALRRMRKTK